MTGMSIQKISEKFKHFFEDSELFTAFLLIIVAIIAFGLGRMSVYSNLKSSENMATVSVEEVSTSIGVTSTKDAETVVASKNGTKYHLPWCSGALRIKEENKITFNTKKEAEDAGYSPAANCKGI